MFDELLAIARQRIANAGLATSWSNRCSTANREQLLTHPAARRNHHAYVGGLLEHTLSVTRTCVYLADKYAEYYPEMKPPLDKDLVVAGGILHDIGKLREMQAAARRGRAHGRRLADRPHPDRPRHGPRGGRRHAARRPADADTLLRLEHLIIAHQGLPEWGSPKPPMTPEALLVHYADDIDAKYHMMVDVLRDDTTPGPVTSKKNILMQHVYRGDSQTAEQ